MCWANIYTKNKMFCFRNINKERDDEHEFAIQCGQWAGEQDKEHWAKEAKKKMNRHSAAQRYQQELDSQLSELRSRSLATLQKTMSEEEENMNLSLVRKYGLR